MQQSHQLCYMVELSTSKPHLFQNQIPIVHLVDGPTYIYDPGVNSALDLGSFPIIMSINYSAIQILSISFVFVS